MSFVTNTHIAVKKWLTIYDHCNPAEQVVLQVLAVFYKPVAAQTFIRVLNRLYQSGFRRELDLRQIFIPKLKKDMIHKGVITAMEEGLMIPVPLHHSLTMLCLENGTLETLIVAINEVAPATANLHWGSPSPDNYQRYIHDCLYLGRFSQCESLLEFNQDLLLPDAAKSGCLVDCCFYPFDQTFFCSLPKMFQYQAFALLLQQLRKKGEDCEEVTGLLQSLHQQGLAGADLQLLLAEQYLLLADIDKASGLLADSDPDSSYALALSGWMVFLQGNTDEALQLFELCKKAKNKIAHRSKQIIGGQPELFYLLALLQCGYEASPDKLDRLIVEVDNFTAINKLKHPYEVSCYERLQEFAKLLNGQKKVLRLVLFSDRFDENNTYFRLSLLLSALCLLWNRQTLSDKYLDRLERYFKHALKHHYLWYAEAVAHVLLKYNRCVDEANALLGSRHTPMINLLQLITPKALWTTALDQLIALQQPVEGQQSGKIQNRLVWLINVGRFPYEVEAKEQKLGKKGWSKGRVMPLKRLATEQHRFDYLTAEDLKICSTISKDGGSYYYRQRETYLLQGYATLKACIGHPNLYSSGGDGAKTTIEIVEGEPELLISQTGEGFNIYMPGLPDDIDLYQYESFYHLAVQTGGRYLLTHFTQKHLNIGDIIGYEGLDVPKAAKDKVIESISAVAPLLNIQSDIEGIGTEDTGIAQIAPDHTLYINIQPAGQGLQMECHVQPLGEHGPVLLPGSGNAMVSAQIGDRRVMTNRELAVEKQQLECLVAACPLFAYMADHLLVLDDLDDALTTLQQLYALNAGSADIADIADSESTSGLLPPILCWPKGKALKLSQNVGQQQMQVSVGKQKDWFALEGELTVGDDQVIELKDLLTLLDSNPGRFVRLEDDTFLALTEQLRQQLRDLASSTYNGTFHPLAVPLIEEATQGMLVDADGDWQQQVKRLKASFEITPQLPATLQAELRDYQQDGYDWACRLSHWGAGACLADDMGLGKTLQALSLLLLRAADGPALVLAPTSVCFNWQEEALRFAPTLTVKVFGSQNKKVRHEMLQNAAPFELIVCSYGLLQSEKVALGAVAWHTIVADEAQALKNPQAKRTQAAMALQGAFKMITTGTPIENNLTELWSLFRFINPGLLGSKEQFQKRFINLIENPDKDKKLRKEAAAALRRIIGPFILRRLKSQVLTELPPRTEINLHVALSKEETAFYEALRQQAVEKLLQTDDKPGQKRIRILAEIMRLRRACCHPALVMADTNIEGSKLKVFDNLVDELKQGNHRALVFSQFVGHLNILRAHLDAKGIAFQYLDGSTTVARRKQAVNAFQAGEGDLFLISLKAGGAGLNLTAADYVIHMDPWWNPAVEDQASDRAHRMGQTRPVTIYRLITQNTIEDKIVFLHQQKRDLANSLLEGTDATGNLSLEDMMQLLKS